MKSTSEGINSINKLSFTIDNTDDSMININTFETGTSSQIESSNKIHNLSNITRYSIYAQIQFLS